MAMKSTGNHPDLKLVNSSATRLQFRGDVAPGQRASRGRTVRIVPEHQSHAPRPVPVNALTSSRPCAARWAARLAVIRPTSPRPC